MKSLSTANKQAKDDVYTLLLPFDLPNRNDRATQCWLRIEDEDVIETVAIYCTIAQAFLRKYIHDYNSRKITEDDVDVSLWNEEPLPIEDVMFRFPDRDQDIKDWKMTTVLDPITRMRIYVTQKALCKVIMYSREGVTNYKVDCDKVLYYVNDRTYSESVNTKPYAVFPIPFELPNRNDRSEQCWLRIEDMEIVDTVTVYCDIAQAFLRSYIHDYNYKKMDEDQVDVGSWNEELPLQSNEIKTLSNSKNIKDWKMTTLFDPTINRRIYVSKKADCKIIMYSREGVTNYKVDCEKILYFVNSRTSKAVKMNCVQFKVLVMITISLLIV
ncbi:hypothetical protein RR46_15140 [Papilio xuthus]|uniref:Uncharacterized protein n=1 Tax=Papilio xuthus TaxID=66420 RepID=A0A194PE60_PAPXU|nr:hypothetical protein RR46_15140 [Papilio xuthus]